MPAAVRGPSGWAVPGCAAPYSPSFRSPAAFLYENARRHENAITQAATRTRGPAMATGPTGAAHTGQPLSYGKRTRKTFPRPATLR